jgi:hypothetical protein
VRFLVSVDAVGTQKPTETWVFAFLDGGDFCAAVEAYIGEALHDIADRPPSA